MSRVFNATMLHEPATEAGSPMPHHNTPQPTNPTMKPITAITLAALLASPLAMGIQDNTTKKPAPAAAESAAKKKSDAKADAKADVKAPADKEATAMREEQGRLALENSLATERLNPNAKP